MIFIDSLTVPLFWLCLITYKITLVRSEALSENFLQLSGNDTVMIFQSSKLIVEEFDIPLLSYSGAINKDCEAISRYNYRDFRCARLIKTYVINSKNLSDLIVTIEKSSELKSWNRKALFLLIFSVKKTIDEEKLRKFMIQDLQVFMYYIIFTNDTGILPGPSNDKFKFNNTKTKHLRITFNNKQNTVSLKDGIDEWLVIRILTKNCGKSYVKIVHKNISTAKFPWVETFNETDSDYPIPNHAMKKHCVLTLFCEPLTRTAMKYYLKDVAHLVNITYIYDMNQKTDGGLYPGLLRPFEQTLHFISVTQVLLYTPLMGWMEPWQTVVVILSKQFWLFTSFSFFAVVFCWWKMKNSKFLINHKKVQFSQIFIYILALKIGSTIPTKFLGINFKHRILFITWLIYSMHFVVVFQGRYCKLLVNPPRKEQVKSFKGVEKSKLDLYVWSPFIEAIQDVAPKYYKTFNYATRFQFWNKLYTNKKMAGVFGGYNFINALFPNMTTLPPYSMNPRSYMTYYNSIWIEFKQHVLIDDINKLIARLIAAGYIQKVEKLITILTFKTFEPDNEPFPLELRHFAVPIVILCIGGALATCVFANEIRKKLLH